MAVQKSKVTRARRGKRRSHHSLACAAITVDSTSGELRRRHNVSPDGFYRGRKVVRTAGKDRPPESAAQ